MRISDWSSDVCSSDLEEVQRPLDPKPLLVPEAAHGRARRQPQRHFGQQLAQVIGTARPLHRAPAPVPDRATAHADAGAARYRPDDPRERSEEHTSELQSLMRISYAVVCCTPQIVVNPRHEHIHKAQPDIKWTILSRPPINTRH